MKPKYPFKNSTSTFIIGCILSTNLTAADQTSRDHAIRLEAAGGWGYLGSADGGTFRGAVSATKLFGHLALQADLNGATESLSYELRGPGRSLPGVTLENYQIGAVVHLGWRDAKRGMFGLAGSYQDEGFGPGNEVRYFRIGGEGEAYWDTWTAGVAFGYLNRENRLTGGFRRGQFVRQSPQVFQFDDAYAKVYMRYYPADNLKFEGGWGIFPNHDPDHYAVQATAEYKFADIPVSLFAHSNWHFSDDSGSDLQAMAGFKLYFGGNSDTLKHYDRAYFADACLFPGGATGVFLANRGVC